MQAGAFKQLIVWERVGAWGRVWKRECSHGRGMSGTWKHDLSTAKAHLMPMSAGLTGASGVLSTSGCVLAALLQWAPMLCLSQLLQL